MPNAVNVGKDCHRAYIPLLDRQCDRHARSATGYNYLEQRCIRWADRLLRGRKPVRAALLLGKSPKIAPISHIK